MNQNYINFTSQTSATDSMLRIFCSLTGVEFNTTKEYVGSFYLRGALDELASDTIPNTYKLLQFNVPTKLNKEQDLSKFKFLINFRDPRDRICNKFHWSLIHPTPGLTEEERVAKIRKVEEKGIDQWVLQNLDANYFDNFWYLFSKINEKDFKVLTYARLCLDFDSFIEMSAKFLEVELNDSIWKSLEKERIENLDNNKDWIGNAWKGSDIFPGRYKKELKPETIERINEHYRDTLEKMAKFDPDYSHLYLEGL